MSLESANRLAELTGCAPRTVKKRLSHMTPVIRGRSQLYEATDAIRAILQPDQKTGGLDPVAEKARLDAARADLAETELAVRRGRLLPADEASAAWTRHIGNARSRLLALPRRVAEVVGQDDAREVEMTIRREIYAALHELSDSTGEAPPEPEGAPSGRP